VKVEWQIPDQYLLKLSISSALRPSTIVCIQVQWNHSDLSGCAPRVGCWLGGSRKCGGGCSYRAEEPVDRHWTVTVVGAD
jgi:hypothetical protein